MVELEVKYRISDVEQVKSRLKQVGARLKLVVKEEDYYFNHPCRDFRLTDEAVRVRVRSNGELELTYKGPRRSSRTKLREEVNVRILDSLDNVLALLSSLGFRHVYTLRKTREVYEVGDYTVTIDYVEGLGSFVEIEYKGVMGNLSELEEKLLGFARSLGLTGKPILKSYLELVLEKELSS